MYVLVCNKFTKTMQNYFSKNIIIFYLLFISSNSLIAEEFKRYIWLSVPYTFTEREKYINAEEVCEYISSKEKNNQNIQKSITQKCTKTPARFIPEKTTTKNLRVHVDCKDKTYDAKGDGKGWRKLVLQETVLNAAKEICLKNGYVFDTNNYILKGENSIPIKPYSIIPHKVTFQDCLIDSINQIRAEKDISLQNPKSIGLSSLEQVNAYYLQLRSKVPNLCEKLTSKKYSGLSKIEIELSLWDPMKLDAIEYVMKNINSCNKN